MRRLPETVKMLNFYKNQTTAQRVKFYDAPGDRFIYGFLLKKEIPYPLAIKFARWNRAIAINERPIEKRDLFSLMQIIEKVIPEENIKGELDVLILDEALQINPSSNEFKPFLAYARILPQLFPPIVIELQPEKFRVFVDSVVKDFLSKRLSRKPNRKFEPSQLYRPK